LLPDFELPLLGGGKLKLSNLRGKAVLLNLWCMCGANETGPSKAEIPTLVELQNKYGPEGFQVIGVSLDDYASTEEISDYAREMNVDYPIVIGNTSSLERRYGGVIFLPMTFFLVPRSGTGSAKSEVTTYRARIHNNSDRPLRGHPAL
jgi:cytochrome c biogenesis protein CcmG/thiol:disulfide interchange protein DsbE